MLKKNEACLEILRGDASGEECWDMLVVEYNQRNEELENGSDQGVLELLMAFLLNGTRDKKRDYGHGEVGGNGFRS